MKRIVGAIVFTAALVVPAGALATAASASPLNLSAKLLSIDQMPTGWRVDNSGGSGIGCLADTLEPKDIKQTATASVSFDDNGNVPELEEKLASYSNTKTAYRKIIANLASCKQVSGRSGGEKVTGTVGQMSFPRYGDASQAFAVNLTIQSLTFGEDILIVRQDNVIMGIDEGDIGPVKVPQFRGFIVMAMQKLEVKG